MDRYSIQYYSRTLAALVGRDKQQTFPLSRWVFDFPVHEVKIVLFDSIKRTDNINLHTGLNMITALKANSVEKASETSKGFVETLLNLVSFSTLTFCNPAKLVSVINISDTDTEAHPFMHYVYPFDGQEILGSVSVIEEATFKALWEAYNKSLQQHRIMRAMSWLRKGIGEESTVDEFISYWIGLEVIKHVLSSEKMNTDKDWEKVEEIFTNRLHFQDFKKIKRDGRNGLLHGFRQLDDEFVKEIGSYVESIRKTLIFCIGSILGLEENTILTITSKTPRRIKQAPWTVMKGNLKNLLRDFNELVKNYPTLDAEIINKQFSINQEGNLAIKFKVTHHFRGPSAIKWELREIEHWGDKDAGIQQWTLDEVRKNRVKKLS